MSNTKPTQTLAIQYTTLITTYYLSEYPCQTNPPASTPVIAYMTLMGIDDEVLQPPPPAPPLKGFNFYINFYPDGTPGIGAPGLNIGEKTVIMDMYYSQLADILRLLQNSTTACYASYTSGPPVHAEVFASTVKPPIPILVPPTVPSNPDKGSQS